MQSRTFPTRVAAAPRDRSARRGFTLIEVLVVITIISLLTALITVASVGFIGQARAAATRSTIKKVDEAILERVSAVNRWHQRPINRLRHDWEIRGWPQRWIAHGLDPFAGTGAGNQGSDDVKFVLSRKGMLMELLPVTRQELMQSYWFWAQFDNDGVVDVEMIRGIPVPYLNAAEMAAMNAFLDDIDGDPSNNVPGTTPGKPSSLNQPGEVFFYALLNAPVFGGLRVLEEDFRPSELIDPDGDGVMELGDAWGNPLRFYRWPTRLVNNGEFDTSTFKPTGDWRDNVGRLTLIPNAPTLDLIQDPDDRAGYLSLINPLYKVPIAVFFHDMNTWHTPLVVSAGPDGRLGLDEPEASYPVGTVPRFGLAGVPLDTSDPAVRATALEELYDNLTNHNGSGGL